MWFMFLLVKGSDKYSSSGPSRGNLTFFGLTPQHLALTLGLEIEEGRWENKILKGTARDDVGMVCFHLG